MNAILQYCKISFGVGAFVGFRQGFNGDNKVSFRDKTYENRFFKILKSTLVTSVVYPTLILEMPLRASVIDIDEIETTAKIFWK